MELPGFCLAETDRNQTSPRGTKHRLRLQDLTSGQYASYQGFHTDRIGDVKGPLVQLLNPYRVSICGHEQLAGKPALPDCLRPDPGHQGQGYLPTPTRLPILQHQFGLIGVLSGAGYGHLSYNSRPRCPSLPD